MTRQECFEKKNQQEDWDFAGSLELKDRIAVIYNTIELAKK